MCPTPTPWWCTTPIGSAWRSSTSCAAGSGRSHRRAYCYLLVPDTIDADAEERLKVLEHHTDLGAGYRIALKDLELRGAGNLLGAEQSGHAQAVGFDLYLRWLEETVRALRGQGDDGAAAAAGRGARPAGPPAGRRTCRTTTSSWTSTGDWRGPRRLAKLMGCEMNCASASGRCRSRPRRCSTWRGFASLGAALGLQHVLVRGDEARLTFRAGTQPRLAGLTSALDDVQLAAEVRRTVPLSLRLMRLGGEPIVPALVRALQRPCVVK